MKKVEDIVGLVLNIAPKKIKNTTNPDNTPEWDSFSGLTLVTELEKIFNVNFSIDEVLSVRNVGDIKKALRKHGVKV